MKFLLYYEISLFADGQLDGGSYDVIKSHLSNYLGQALAKDKRAEIKSILSESAYTTNLSTHEFDALNPILIKDEEFLAIAPRGTSFLELYLKTFFSTFSPQEQLRFEALIKSKLGDWIPDIIITFPIHNKLLKNLYPKALLLGNENGIFSRSPFPRTLRYEPLHYINSFTNTFCQQLKTLTLSKEQSCQVDSFRTAIIEKIERHNPYKNQLSILKKQFKHLVLLPVIWGENEYKESPDNDEYSFIINTLSELPSDIGVIITTHEGVKSKITPTVLSTLKLNHPNLISANDFKRKFSCGSPSLYFFNHVDAVLNCMTTTGLQAAIWNTRIIALDKHYSNWFADSIGLDNIEAKLSAPTRNRNPLLYWYLTHCLVWEKHFDNPNWLFEYFNALYKSYSTNGITLSFFPQVNSFEDIKKYTLETIDKQYKRACIFDLLPKFLLDWGSKIKQLIQR